MDQFENDENVPLVMKSELKSSEHFDWANDNLVHSMWTDIFFSQGITKKQDFAASSLNEINYWKIWY